MKKFIKYISMACLGIISLNSCTDDDTLLQVNPNDFVSPVLKEDVKTIILDENNQNSVALNFDWTPSTFGIATTVMYQIELTKEGESFEDGIVLTSTTELNYEITVKDFNEKLINLGLEPNQEAKVSYRILAGLGTYLSNPVSSNVITISVTPFSTDASTPWGLVGSATPNGWNGPDVPFWKTDKPNELVAYARLQPNEKGESEFKIRRDNEWKEDFGGSNGKLVKGGSNIALAKAGNYKITINLVELTYTIEEFQWGLVGSATTNGWDGPDADALSYDGLEEAWYGRVTLKDGEIKFRQNSKWDLDYGGANGVLEKGGANIKVTAGTYDVIANFKTLTYSLTPVK